MSRRILIGIVVGGVSLFLLVRGLQHARRPAYQSHITGDAAAREGIALVENGQFAEALEALKFATQQPRLEVEDSMLFETFARAYEGLDREGKGESQKHQALVFQGLAHRLRGDYEKAAAAFTAAQQVRPDYAPAYESLGSMRLTQGRYEEAIAPLERAVDLDPAKALTRSNLAIAYAKTGRFTEADLQVQQAERLGYPNLEQLRSFVENLRAQGDVGN